MHNSSRQVQNKGQGMEGTCACPAMGQADGSWLRLTRDELKKCWLQTCLLSRASGVGIGVMRGSFVVDVWLKSALLHVHFHERCLPI